MTKLKGPIIRKRFAGRNFQSFFVTTVVDYNNLFYKCIGKFEDGIKGWVLMLPKNDKAVLLSNVSRHNVFDNYIAFEWGHNI